jgi:hypothetical protein
MVDSNPTNLNNALVSSMVSKVYKEDFKISCQHVACIVCSSAEGCGARKCQLATAF